MYAREYVDEYIPDLYVQYNANMLYTYIYCMVYAMNMKGDTMTAAINFANCNNKCKSILFICIITEKHD